MSLPLTVAQPCRIGSGPTEDPTKGVKFGGWVTPYFDKEFGEEVDRVFKERFDLLPGRNTCEIFAAYWPYAEGGPNDGIAKLLKKIKKYAVSRSGEVDTSWAAARSCSRMARRRIRSS